MNSDDWEGSLPCGACANVTGPHGQVTVEIVDLCPECVHGDLDLSPDAFERLAPLVDGRIQIAWELVACEPEGPITWQFSAGSNPWWVAVQVRNHRNQVASVQADTGDGWRQMTRTNWNHFIAEAGLGAGPFRLRAIDVHGEIIVDDAVPLLEDAGVDGPTQFPSCE
jgi:expansin